MLEARIRRQAAPPYAALTIAKWFIAWAEAEGEELSNLKLQKLLYYAQGHHLAERHQPLFTEQIQAWSHGPVVPQVYHEYKSCGSSSIVLPDTDSFSWDDVHALDAAGQAAFAKTLQKLASSRGRISSPRRDGSQVSPRSCS
jgi:uncharacterized phage-associated protein